MSVQVAALPSDNDNEELLLSCRYGDLGDVKQFVDTFGPAPLSVVRDDNGNSILHMVAGNGQNGELPPTEPGPRSS